jgi:GxxExxY protein
MPNRRSTKGYDFEQLSHDVIGACIDVQRQLGIHCMEVDYQRALELALPKRGLQFQREVEIPIAYDGVVVTKRRVDFVIWNDSDELILETKARSAILPEDIEQCLLYLHQGGYCLCLLVNFGEKPLGVRRFVHTPEETSSDSTGAGEGWSQ